jgi:hypothetical protein
MCLFCGYNTKNHVKKGVKIVRMKMNPYDYKFSAREAAIKCDETSLSAN